MSDTLVTFVLDRSGSMGGCKDATIEAFNAYLDGLKKDPAGIRFSLVQFDSQGIETPWKNAEIGAVPGLTHESYQPRGGTPLIDAAYKTIKAVEKKVAEYATAPKVVICIQTDGEENSSTQFTWNDLNALIKEKSDAGWQFNFMGAGIDAYKQGNLMGIASANTMSYDHHDLRKTRAAFSANASNTSLYARGMSADTSYSFSQKEAAGDAFQGQPDLSATLTVHASPSKTQTLTSPRRPLKPLVDDIEL